MNKMFLTKEIEIKHFYKGQEKKEKVLNICYKNELNCVLPHPVTDFIRLYYQNKGLSLNSQKNAARELCKFLNFINEQISNNNINYDELKYLGITGIRIEHFVGYFEMLYAQGVKKTNFDFSIKTLTNFIYYLNKNHIVENQIILDERYEVGQGLKIAELGIQRPKKNFSNKHKLKDFGENKNLMIKEFLTLALKIHPEIALGVAFQIYGGLRAGEVVNLKRGSVSKKNNVFILEIRDNQEELFNHLNDTTKEQVKNERNQMVLPKRLVEEIYEKHLMYLENLGTEHCALFVGPKGLPISGSMYQKKFDNIKEYYIESLSKAEGRYEDFILLKESYWGSHIGRGLFSNILLDLNLNPTQVAILRGDSNIDSVLKYVDKKQNKKIIDGILNQLSEDKDGE
jgi:integrase